jgi:D-alanine-D-alanine ligase
MTFAAKNPLRILVLVHQDLVPPETTEGLTDKEIAPWKAEYDVTTTLEEMGHEVRVIGLYSDLGVIHQALEEHRPHIAFNMLEEFHGHSLYDQHVVSYLELERQPYTGCNPRGLTLAHDKALSKKILAYHRIQVPGFQVFPMNRKVRRPSRLKFPLLVKSISEEGSAGISQASIVYDDAKLTERVEFVHRQVKTHAIAEQYIAGREIYVGVLGNQRLQTFTPWELLIRMLPEGSANIATGKLKWDYAYQERVGVATEAAEITPELSREISRLSKRIYRLLGLTGYARLDYRLTDDGRLYLLEANPNPNISYGEDFAEAAEHAGIPYKQLLQKIVTLGLSYSSTE